MIHYLHLYMQNKNIQNVNYRLKRPGLKDYILREYSRQIWYSSFPNIGKKPTSPYPTHATQQELVPHKTGVPIFKE